MGEQPAELYTAQAATGQFPKASCDADSALQGLAKKPKLFLVHLMHKSHDGVLEGLAGSMATCPGKIDLGLYEVNNVFLFSLEDDCEGNAAMLKSIFARDEIKRHNALVVLRSPCRDGRQMSPPAEKSPKDSRALIMHRYNYYDKEVATTMLRGDDVVNLEVLFTPFPMNVSMYICYLPRLISHST